MRPRSARPQITCSHLSGAQVIAYELASRGLCRLLDDIAQRIRGRVDGDGFAFHLAEEARWAMLAIHEHLSRGVVRHLRAHARDAQPYRLAEPLRRRSGDGDWNERRELVGIATILANAKATLKGLYAGCSTAYAATHALMAAFRAAESALETLLHEVEGAHLRQVRKHPGPYAIRKSAVHLREHRPPLRMARRTARRHAQQ